MDGLLIDSERLALQAFQETCDIYEMGDQFNLYMELLGTNRATTRSVLAHSLDSRIRWQTFLHQWDERYDKLTSPGVPLMSGVAEILDYLDARDIPMAVATSTNTDKACHKLDQAGILHRFATITGGDQVSNGKPAPDIYLSAAKSVNTLPSTCIALEDSANGIRAAVAAGMYAVQVPQLAPPDDALLALGHLVLDNLVEAIDHLQALHESDG